MNKKDAKYNEERRRLIQQLRKLGQAAFRHETNAELRKRIGQARI